MLTKFTPFTFETASPESVGIAPASIAEFEARLREFMEASHYSSVLTAIRETGKLEKDTEEDLKAALNELLVEFVKPE